MPKSNRPRRGRVAARSARVRCAGALGRPVEQLEPRRLMAGDVPTAFEPLSAWDPEGLYDKGVSYPFLKESPIRSWPVLKTNHTLLLFDNNKFRKLDENGNDLGFNVAVRGVVKDVLPLEDGGILVWGTLTASDVGWFGGGFDITYNGGATDGFVVKIRNNSTIEWGTFIGGDGADSVSSAGVVTSYDSGTKTFSQRLVIVGTTDSRSGFVRSGDTVFDATSAASGSASSTSTNGFVVVLDNLNQPGDTGFQSHVWSSYMSPQDPTTLSTISPAGKFVAPSADLLVTVSRTGESDAIGILAAKSDTAAGGIPGSSATTRSLVSLQELPNRMYQFDAIRDTSVSIPQSGMRRGNLLYYVKGDLQGEVDARRIDPDNNVSPVPGTPGQRVLGCMKFELNQGRAWINQVWERTTAFSLRGYFIDPFVVPEAASQDKTHENLYVIGTLFDKSVQPELGSPNLSVYQGGYGDPVIVEMGADGTPLRYQYVSGDRFKDDNGRTLDPQRRWKEKGWAIAVTDDSRTLMAYTARHFDPAPGQSVSAVEGGRLYRYKVRDASATITVASASTAASVPDGASASVTLGTDFGKVSAASVPVARSFTVRNSGIDDLVLQQPTVSPGFTISGDAFAGPIPKDESRTFTILLQPTNVGVFQGECSFRTNDKTASLFNFAIKGEVIAPPPSTFSVAAAAASVLEGNSGTKAVSFTVTLTPGAPAPVYPLTVAYSLVGVTATAGTDFTGGSGTLTFASASDLVKTVAATVRGDAQAEQNETFKLVLSSPSSGVVSAEAGEAVVTITNDDGTPKPLSVGFAPATYRVPEGAAGTTTLVPLTIQLTESQATDVVVSYATSNGTASAGSDYTATSGTVKILAGQTQGTLNVVVKGDATGESDETFTVRLTSSTGGVLLNPAAATVTIVNDDGAAPLPAVRVSTASVTEGNTGTPKMTFTITLAKALTTATVLTYATLDGTAKAGSHYVAATGTVTIPAGRTSATVTVTVKPNRIVDGNRTLSLQVRSGSTLVATGVGTIIDDDKAAVRAAFAAFAAEPVSTGVTKKK